MVLGISAPANAIVFTTFTDRATWEAAVGGSFSEEDFNAFTVDTSFPANVGDFTLTGENNIDVPPMSSSAYDVNGTSVVVGRTRTSSSLTATFDSPITAFGATFKGTSDLTGLGITQITADSDLVGSIPRIPSTTTGFFGFTADGDFTTVTFDSANGATDVFGMDDVVYNTSSASVPFEFSPTLGLFAVGGIWGISRLRKRIAASKITE